MVLRRPSEPAAFTRQLGQDPHFDPHEIAVDRDGSVYTAEVLGTPKTSSPNSSEVSQLEFVAKKTVPANESAGAVKGSPKQTDCATAVSF
jgi:hypothetical protein